MKQNIKSHLSGSISQLINIAEVELQKNKVTYINKSAIIAVCSCSRYIFIEFLYESRGNKIKRRNRFAIQNYFFFVKNMTREKTQPPLDCS